MNLLKAAAAVTLWNSGMFDTMNIAEALSVTEADVCIVIQAARNRAHQRPNWTPVVIEGVAEKVSL